MSRGTDTTKFGREISMKIVHLSDLHISLKNLPQNLEYTERLVTYGLEMGADHFVFTGDISHEGKDEDFLAFRNLLERYRLLTSEKTTLVIGNHDIYGGVHLPGTFRASPKNAGIPISPKGFGFLRTIFTKHLKRLNSRFPKIPCCLSSGWER